MRRQVIQGYELGDFRAFDTQDKEQANAPWCPQILTANYMHTDPSGAHRSASATDISILFQNSTFL